MNALPVCLGVARQIGGPCAGQTDESIKFRTADSPWIDTQESASAASRPLDASGAGKQRDYRSEHRRELTEPSTALSNSG